MPRPFLILVLILATARAQVAWEQTNGAGPPVVLALAASPGGEVWMNLGTKFNPAGGYIGSLVMRSTDNGASWTTVTNGLPLQVTLGIGFTSAGTVLAAVRNFGVFRLSSVNATTWVASNTGLSNATMNGFVQLSNGAILASSAFVGVYRSTNDGVSWSASNTGLTTTNVVSLHATSTAGEVFACTNAGVFRSSDYGVTWSASSTGLGSNDTRQMATASGGRRFVATAAGVFTSSDNGANWAAANNGIATLDVQSIAVAGGQIFAATRGGGVFRSNDDGASWTDASTGLPNLVTSRLLVNGANLFVTSNGLHRTGDGGASWQPANPVGQYGLVRSLFVHSNGSLFAGSVSSGVFRTLDRGGTWGAMGVPNAYISGFAQHPNGEIFATINGFPPGITTKIWRGGADGSSWQPVNGGSVISTSLGGIAFTSDGTGYACSFASPSYVIRGDNAGLDWTTTLLQGNPGISMAASAAGDLYLGAETTGLWRRLAGGSWTQIALTNRDVFRVVFAPNGDAIIPTAGTGGRGIHRLPTNTTAWTDLYTAGPCYCAAVTPGGEIFAGTGSGVIYSADGTSWSSASSGLADQPVLDLAIGTDGRLYAATGGAGVWRTTLPVQTPASAIEAWRYQRFGTAFANPAVSGNDADPDGDGESNLVEYAFGTDPLSTASQSRPVPSLTNVSGLSYLTLTFTRAASDLTYTVRHASALGAWTDGSTYSGTASTPDTAVTTQVSRSGELPETIVVRSNTPVEAANAGFLELRITIP